MGSRDTRTPEQQGMLCVATTLCEQGILQAAGFSKLETLIEDGHMRQVGGFLEGAIRDAGSRLSDVEATRLQKTIRASVHLASLR